jgi:hypothetical protein
LSDGIAPLEPFAPLGIENEGSAGCWVPVNFCAVFAPPIERMMNYGCFFH